MHKWAETEFGDELEGWFRKAKLGHVLPLDGADEIIISPQKRRRTQDEPSSSAVKHEPVNTDNVAAHEAKVEQKVDYVPIGAIPSVSATFNLASTSKLTLQFTVDHKLFITNSTDEPVELKCGSSVALYYKGSWVSKRSPATANDSMVIPFLLTDSSMLVQFGSSCKPLGPIVEEHRAVDPTTAKVAYHELQDNPLPEDQTAFKLTVKHPQTWKFENSPVKAEPNAIQTGACAGLVSYQNWNSRFTTLTWLMRWTNKGLTPVRPLIIAKTDVVITPNAALEIHSE